MNSCAAMRRRLSCRVAPDKAHANRRLHVKRRRDVPPVDRTKRTLTDGSPETSDHRELRPDGMQKGYIVLSAEERARGFVRPAACDAYRHLQRWPARSRRCRAHLPRPMPAIRTFIAERSVQPAAATSRSAPMVSLRGTRTTGPKVRRWERDHRSITASRS